MPPKPRSKARRGGGATSDLFHYNNQVELTFKNQPKSKVLEDISSSDEESKTTIFKSKIPCNVVDTSSSDSEDSVEDLCTPPKRVHDIDEEKVEETVHLVDRPVTPPPAQLPLDIKDLQSRQALKLSRDVGNKLKSLQAVTQQDQSPFGTVSGWSDVVVVDQSMSPSVADRKITLKIRARDGVARFPVMMTETFDGVIRKLATKHDVPMETISLSFTDKHGSFQTLKGTDSPISVNLSTADIIECHIVHLIAPSLDSTEDGNENVVNIKIQGSQPNSTKLFKVFKNEALGNIMQQYADFRQLKVSKLRFYFDGDLIQSSQTPEDLDMDDDNMIEVRIS